MFCQFRNDLAAWYTIGNIQTVHSGFETLMLTPVGFSWPTVQALQQLDGSTFQRITDGISGSRDLGPGWQATGEHAELDGEVAGN